MELRNVDHALIALRAPHRMDGGDHDAQVCKVTYGDNEGKLLVVLPAVRAVAVDGTRVLLTPLRAQQQAVAGMLALEQTLVRLLCSHLHALGKGANAHKLASSFQSCVCMHPEHRRCLRCRLVARGSHHQLVEGACYTLTLHVRGVRVGRTGVSVLFGLHAVAAADGCFVEKEDEEVHQSGSDSDYDHGGPDEAELREHVQLGLCQLLARLDAELQTLAERRAEAQRLAEALPRAPLKDVIRVGDLLPDL